MRKELQELEKIEAYLEGRLDHDDQKGFQIQLLLNPALAEKVKLQQLSYSYIKASGRSELKKELAQINHRLWTAPSYNKFRLRIRSIFG